MREYFPKLKSVVENVKVELDLFNYADLKNATGIDTSEFAKKTDLGNLKSDLDKFNLYKLKNVPINLSNLKSKEDILDVDKLVSAPADLSKLDNVVKMMLLKKMHVMLRSKILKIKYLILPTWLLIPLLMVK